MKKSIVILMCLWLLLLCGGCSSMPYTAGSSQKDTQRYTKIEVYAPDQTLLNTVEDSELLARFNDTAVFTENSSAEPGDDDLLTAAQEVMKSEAENAVPQFLIVSYKSPAALINDKELIKISEITVYEDSDIIREHISSEAVPSLKLLALSEDLLTFFYEADEEQLSFLRSLADAETGPQD